MQRLSAVDELADSIRAVVLDGTVRSGTRLREVEITAAYGVARNTVRSALQTLVHEGLLEHWPHRGISVRRFSKSDISDIFILRAALETEAARAIASNDLATQGVFEAVEALEAIDGAPWRDVMTADLAFHSALVHAVGSPRMDNAFASVIFQMQLIAAQPLDRPASQTVAQQHRVIAEAVASGDADAAINETRAHLTLARVRMLLASDQPDDEPWPASSVSQ